MKQKLLFVLFAACGLYGALELLGSFITRVVLYFQAVASFAPAEVSSIGIIGGADGPTAIFVATAQHSSYIFPVLMLILGIGGILWLRRKK